MSERVSFDFAPKCGSDKSMKVSVIARADGNPSGFIDYHESELDKPIYRFMPFSNLIKTFLTREFILARTSKWDDPFENFIIGVRFRDGNATLDLSNRHLIHGSCWTKKSSSDALWRIYSPDKLAVRVASTPRKIGAALTVGMQKWSQSAWFIGRVSYLPQATIVKLANTYAREMLGEKAHEAAARSVLFKRRSFAHEDEVRVLVLDRNRRSKGGLVKIRVDPHEFFTAVMFDSRTPPQIAEMHKTYLRERLEFKGKVTSSTLYDLPTRLTLDLREKNSE